MTLKDRARAFIDEMGIMISAFCGNVKILSTTYYDWQRGQRNISDSTRDRIETYLEKFGY